MTDLRFAIEVGSPLHIYYANFEQILVAIREDGEVSHNDVEKILTNIKKIAKDLSDPLLVQSNFSAKRMIDPTSLKSEALSIWEPNVDHFSCTFLKKPNVHMDMEIRPCLSRLCVAGQVLELLAKCSIKTKTIMCEAPTWVPKQLDYLNVVAYVTGINVISLDRDEYAHAIFLPIGQNDKNVCLASLCIDSVMNGSTGIPTLGISVSSSQQFIGIYLPHLLKHVSKMIAHRDELVKIKLITEGLKFY